MAIHCQILSVSGGGGGGGGNYGDDDNDGCINNAVLLYSL